MIKPSENALAKLERAARAGRPVRFTILETRRLLATLDDAGVLPDVRAAAARDEVTEKAAELDEARARARKLEAALVRRGM